MGEVDTYTRANVDTRAVSFCLETISCLSLGESLRSAKLWPRLAQRAFATVGSGSLAGRGLAVISEQRARGGGEDGGGEVSSGQGRQAVERAHAPPPKEAFTLRPPRSSTARRAL
eukprot:6182029-Pleurochrysis_carterae.AAC.2